MPESHKLRNETSINFRTLDGMTFASFAVIPNSKWSNRSTSLRKAPVSVMTCPTAGPWILYDVAGLLRSAGGQKANQSENILLNIDSIGREPLVRLSLRKEEFNQRAIAKVLIEGGSTRNLSSYADLSPLTRQ